MSLDCDANLFWGFLPSSAPELDAQNAPGIAKNRVDQLSSGWPHIR